MAKIVRGLGLTASERYLAHLADRTFLRLWSYPNLFYDKRSSAKGDGKELSDLLVVCGEDILIFSDKAIEWQAEQPHDVAWARWYNRAVAKSVDQIRGAERWLKLFPKRIFLDCKCTQPFPIDLPDPARRRVHGIIVATGATEAIKRYFGDDSGSFILNGNITGRHHIDPTAEGWLPFSIGDVDPNGPFVHVFDPTALDIVMRELDTLDDFTSYLTKRAAFIRSGRFGLAFGEEDLLAFYLQNSDPGSGDHYFWPEHVRPEFEDRQMVVAQGEYREFIASPGYARRAEADKVSYFWDQLIDLFVDSVLEDSMVKILGELPDAALSERGLRFMALEDRVHRRMLGKAFTETLELAKRRGLDRFVRRTLSQQPREPRTGYVFLVLAYPKDIPLAGGYADYRKVRANILHSYCMDLFDHRPELDFVVGIGVDAAPEITGRIGGSEDLVAIERPIWTTELRERLERDREMLNMTDLSKARENHINTTEFPPDPSVSRQRRRAQERAVRKVQRPQPLRGL
jgi:hypothetical protein